MICIDTTVCVQGVQYYRMEEKVLHDYLKDRYRDNYQEQLEKIDKAGRFVEHLTEEEIAVMIPSPVVAEYLTGLSDDIAERHLQILQEMGTVYDLDMASSFEASRLYRSESKSVGRKQDDRTNPQIKADAMICGIAVVHGASQIVTDNTKHFQRLADAASRNIQVMRVPSVPTQQEMDMGQQ